MIAATLNAAELYAACRDQVPPVLRDALYAEIARQWPDGLRLTLPESVETPNGLVSTGKPTRPPMNGSTTRKL